MKVMLKSVLRNQFSKGNIATLVFSTTFVTGEVWIVIRNIKWSVNRHLPVFRNWDKEKKKENCVHNGFYCSSLIFNFFFFVCWGVLVDTTNVFQIILHWNQLFNWTNFYSLFCRKYISFCSSQTEVISCSKCCHMRKIYFKIPEAVMLSSQGYW